MSALRIYDTKGNEYSPSGGTGRTNERIKQLFYAGVRFSVESVGETRIIAFFRARETRDARSEQFYAEYTAGSVSNLRSEFESALRQRVESEWGYTIDERSKGMEVFRAVVRNETTVPGTEQERRILRELIRSGPIANIGVRDANAAVGLMQDVPDARSRVAITDSEDTDSLSDFDVAFVTGSRKEIEPLGETADRWERTEESLRERFIEEEIETIQGAVQSLSREYGLSSGEIRSRVTRRVPALKQPTTSGPSSLGSSGNLGNSDSLLPSGKVGMYVAVAAIALAVILGGVYGAGLLLGVGPLAGDTAPDDVIEGVVLDAESEDADAIADAEIQLLNQNGTVEGENTTNDDGAFGFSDLEPDGEYTLSVTAADHNFAEEDVTAGDTGLELTPIADDESVTGTVVDATEGEAIGEATVDLFDEEGEHLDNATTDEGGEFTFLVEDLEAEYMLEARADGYDAESVDGAITDESVRIELEESITALEGTVQDSDDGETIDGATITAEGDADTQTGETDADGNYELELERGQYEVTADADDFMTDEESVVADEDVVEQNFELDAQASWSGVVVEEGDESQTLNGAEITLSVDNDVVDEETSDTDGEFTFTNLDPVEYTVEIEDRTGYADYSETIEFEPGEESEQNIELEPE